MPIDFNAQDPLHIEFVISVASMRAGLYHLPPIDSIDGSLLGGISVEVFQPKEGVKIATTDEEAKADNEGARQQSAVSDVDKICQDLIDSLPPPASISQRLRVFEFDKDTDAHMRVVAAVSNLRARNYRIPEADLHTSRGIAGNITPAIATTTALVTGAICMELYKILQNKPVTQLCNSFANLALPLFTSMEPEPPKSVKAVVKGSEWKWTQVMLPCL